jgi:hydrogenase/urease accessory protein HupE
MPTLFLAAACAASALAHEVSRSSSRIDVDGARAAVEIQCQARSLAEALPIDLDLDGAIDTGELERGRGQVERYLRERYRVRPDEAAPELDLRLERLEPFRAPDGEALVRARLAATAPQPLERLTVAVTLFRERDPYHLDTASIAWNGAAPVAWVFGEGVETWRFLPADARRGGVLATYLRLGVAHILTGYDHLAFLVALLVASRRLRSMVAIVTAFTAAHSVTLGAAALEVVALPARPVELAIALSVAYVGAENLLVEEARGRSVVAFVFGLVHGFGFAGFLGESLLHEPLKLTALAGFNLGVELGQLAVVAAASLALRFAPGERARESGARTALAPRWVRRLASAAIALLGSVWFAQRAGWLA